MVPSSLSSLAHFQHCCRAGTFFVVTGSGGSIFAFFAGTVSTLLDLAAGFFVVADSDGSIFTFFAGAVSTLLDRAVGFFGVTGSDFGTMPTVLF